MAAFQREDALGLPTTTYAPQILAIQQSGNLYVYCVDNPVDFADPSGELTTAAVKAIKIIMGGVFGGLTRAYNYAMSEAFDGREVSAGDLIWQFLIGAGVGAAAAAWDAIADLITIGAAVIEALYLIIMENDYAAAASMVVSACFMSLVGSGLNNPFANGKTAADFSAKEIVESMIEASTDTLVEIGEQIVDEVSSSGESNTEEQPANNDSVYDSESESSSDSNNQSNNGSVAASAPSTPEDDNPPSHGGGGGIGDVRRIAMP